MAAADDHHQLAAPPSLAWLLSADPCTPLGAGLQPRAVCLPLAEQHAASLRCSAAAADARHGEHAAALRLLQVLAASDGGAWRASAARTAAAALQQQQQQLGAPISLAPLPPPAWLQQPSARPCFSWLARGSQLPAGAGEAAGAGQQLAAAALDLPQPPTPAGRDAASGAPQAAAADDDAAPVGKRARLSPAADADEGAAADDQAAPLPAGAGALELLLQQLQGFAAACSASSVDLQLLRQGLVAAAAAPGSGASQQLSAQLQQLPPDALQLLLDEALAGAAAGAGAGDASGQLAGAALAHLLRIALLPRLQLLDSAPPKALLACLESVARADAAALLRVVLAPVVCSPGLLAVQVQLLAKLCKQAPGLQLGLLELLQLAAGATPAPGQPLGAPCHACVWAEPHASLLKALLDSAPQALAQQLDGLLGALAAAVAQPALAKSAVFGQLLMGLLKAFAPVLSARQAARLQAIAGGTACFLSRALAARLAALVAQHEAAAAAGAAPA